MSKRFLALGCCLGLVAALTGERPASGEQTASGERPASAGRLQTTTGDQPPYGGRSPDAVCSPDTGRSLDFRLTDPRDGSAFALASAKDKKAVVVLFLGTECPVNNQYMRRLGELHQEFAPKGVQFVAVNANLHDEAKRVAEHARQNNIPFPVLKDEGSAVADRFGARRTPEVFLLDAGRAVRYRGRIDDQYGVSFQRPKPTRRDLAEALNEVLAGKPVSVPETAVAGCVIARPLKAKGNAEVTYTRHVSRILQNHCTDCHRPGQIGPMSLRTYESAASWAETIREVVQERRMPPWFADPRHGTFSNDRSLPAAERDTLLKWIDLGCPKGDEKDLPPAKQYASDWRMGKPDAIFTMPTESTVPAEAARGVPYRYFVVDPGFKEDVWVQAAEARPGNRAVVHHIIVYVFKAGQGLMQRGEDRIGDGFLVAYAPGDQPAIFSPGIAKKIPKGSRIVFQMHYTPNGVEQTDRSSVGLIFAKEPPKFQARTRSVANRMVIPAGAPNHEVRSTSTFRKDAVLVALMPHMHLRGKDFKYEVVYPDGKTETLLSVPRYDFNWQNVYRLQAPLKLPAGTKINCTAHFDNSTANPNNPDPTKTVTWGDQTWQEMMIGFVDYYYLDEQVGAD